MGRNKGTERGARKRRGKGESMTGAKDNKVEVRRGGAGPGAGAGDNSKLALPAPEDWDHHYRSIKGLKEKSATASSLVRHAKNSANKSCHGMAAAIEQTLSIERENDPVKLKKHLELLGIGLRQVGSSIQLSVFDTLLGESKDQAYTRGFKMAKDGHSLTNPYPAGSDLAAECDRGWRHGTAENLGVSKEDADKAHAAQESEGAVDQGSETEEQKVAAE